MMHSAWAQFVIHNQGAIQFTHSYPLLGAIIEVTTAVGVSSMAYASALYSFNDITLWTWTSCAIKIDSDTVSRTTAQTKVAVASGSITSLHYLINIQHLLPALLARRHGH